MADQSLRIVVVGGVAGGMSAAARARRLSEQADILVLERDEYVSFANCGLPYHISGEIRDRSSLFVVTPEDLARRLNLEVRTRHEVLAIDREQRRVEVLDHRTGHRYQEPFDRLVLAPGARPVRPPIPGIDHAAVHTLRNVPDMDEIKEVVDGGAVSAVVVGGGYIGIEMAEALRHRGLRVDLVELSDQLMGALDPEMSHDLAFHMESYGVNVYLANGVKAIEDLQGRAEVELADGRRLMADLVVMAIGVRAESELAQQAGLELGERGGIRVDQHMRTSDPHIYAVGDAVEVRDTGTGEWSLIPLAGPANRQGRIAADHIFGRDSHYRGTQGTAVIKVFDMTAGGTGSSEKSLRRHGHDYRKIYIHPNGHASYYPGTHPMHLKLLFSPVDGRVLGAQVVGFDGVDKRIDVLATAIHAEMTVYDLEELELAYAPPYGSAKDPVNMAGFVAANVLRGDAEAWYAEEWPELTEERTIIDVRSPQEYETWHIPGAVNIPIGELRGRLHELESAREEPIYLYCLSGFRSYLGVRLLRQAGFDEVANLSGGLKTFLGHHRNPHGSGKPAAPWEPYAEQRQGKVEEIPVV